jgi:hypothetical protein
MIMKRSMVQRLAGVAAAGVVLAGIASGSASAQPMEYASTLTCAMWNEIQTYNEGDSFALGYSVAVATYARGSRPMKVGQIQDEITARCAQYPGTTVKSQVTFLINAPSY